MEYKKTPPVEGVVIDLSKVLNVLFGNIFIIILTGLTFAMVTAVYCKTIAKPSYQSKAKVYVLAKQNSIELTNNDVEMSASLTQDYSEVLKSRDVIERTIARIPELGNMTYEEFMNSLTIQTNTADDSRILFITVTYGDPFLAQTMVSTLVEVAIDNVKVLTNEEAIKTVETASIPYSASAPRTKLLTIIAFLFGSFIAIVFTFISTLADKTIRTPEDINEYLKISVLGMIPVANMTKADNKKKKRKK